MNREIKFRAWDTDAKQMLLADRHRWYSEHGSIIHEIVDVPAPNGCYDTKVRRLFNGEIMQFTGLSDKSGVEIYEGDIVQTDSEDGVVTGRITFDMNYEDDESFWWSGFCLKVIEVTDYTDDEPIELIVIGNIYSNPELLGEQR